MSQLKIALTGKARSGKTTAADFIETVYQFESFAFADELKKITHYLFGEKEGKMRDYYQKVGQYMRAVDANVWINKLDSATSDTTSPILVTDLRQPNEYVYLRNSGYKIVRINSLDDLRVKRMHESGDIFNSETTEHETESYVDNFVVDYEIYNNGNLDDFISQLEEIMFLIIDSYNRQKTYVAAYLDGYLDANAGRPLKIENMGDE